MLQYDKPLIISAAGSRKAQLWAGQTLYWSEMIARLATPARSPETLMEYLRLPKSRQDDLKDVGGFVGGTLAGGRRKANAVTGRDIVTLDFDAIPPMETENILKRLFSLNIAFVVYSTRKHEPVRPRLRVVIPLSRTCTADEYEPLARKLAECIGIDMCDPTTFEASRLMYWPSVCVGAEYIYQYADKFFVDADGTLAMYPDWRDVTAWPQVQGAQKAQQRLFQKQEDPTTKTGIVGAFCRTYNLYQAMDTFLPGAYEPVAGSNDRYTFVGGSTTGGAVVYDNGLYLFSHHATDPASGRLVNAFDLVRLHRFGDLDDEAKEGTPTVKLPSYAAMCEYAKSLPEVHQLFTKEAGEEIRRDFADSPTDDALAEFLGELKGGILTTRVVRDLLKALGITTRTNEISRETTVTGHPSRWSQENAENHLPVYLLDFLKLAQVKGATKTAVCDCLDVIADENRFNPVTDMFKSTEWDGVDRVAELMVILGLVPGSFHATLYFKGLLQSVAMPHNSANKPFGADGVPTLQGPQGIGKTSVIREIIPFSLQGLFKDSVILNPRDKDSVIEISARWINELGELDGVTKRDQQGVKGFITAATDEYRTPYARKKIRLPRRTVLWGTVNPDEYLTDSTGNRRFLTIPVEKIDLHRLFNLSEEWRLQLWAQLYACYRVNPQGFRLTPEERKRLEQENQQHEKPLAFELEIRSMLNYGLPIEQWGSFTAAELSMRMLARPPANRLGHVLAKLAREDERIIMKIVHRQGVYTLPIVKTMTLI